MKILLKVSAAALALAAAPALADIVVVDASSIQGSNVLFNDNNGIETGATVTGRLNDSASTRVSFMGNGGTTLRAGGGQAEITGALNTGTRPPNDTLDFSGFTLTRENGGLFNNVELNLVGGAATAVTFQLIDNMGTAFNFSGADFALRGTGNGENRFGFQAISGQLIRSLTFTTVGGGIQSVRQVRLDAVAGPGGVNAIPEPATWAMMIGGFGMIGAASRRRSLRNTVSA